MSKKPPRLPRTPRNCSSPAQMEKTGSGSSRSSDSPIHWETLTGTVSPKTTKIEPSSWDNSDDELPLTLEKDIPRGHIYSSESLGTRKSVAAEINDLKKQFFQAVVTETVTDIEDLREKLEKSLKNDRRQSPARVRRRTKSSSSSSTVMDVPGQSSPKKEDEFNQQYEAIFDNTENTAPILELDSRFYLDNFFAELRRKRISILESTVGIANERDEEDFREIVTEDPNEFVNLSDCGYFNRSSRKLSQILEVEENKKDSDKDAEEYSENPDLFLKFSRKPEDNDSSPLHTARSMKNEKLFENLKEKEYKFKCSSGGFKNCKKHRRDALAIASELDDEVISLTAKTGAIQLSSPKQKDVRKKNNLQQIEDCDVNWTLIENLKLDLIKTPENSTPRRSSRRDRNSGSGSRRTTRDACSQSPKFMINLGKESGRSLKADEIKTPNSIGKNSVTESGRSIKDDKSSSGSVVQVAENTLLDLKSPSLESHTSNQSLELQHILLDQGVNTSRYSQRSDYANEVGDQAETSNGSEMPYRTNRSESSSRSVNSKTSRSSRSYRLSSRATESRMSSQISEKLESLEPLEKILSRRSSSISSRTELELRQTNTARSEKSRASSSRNKEPMKLTPRGTQTATPPTSKSYTEDVCSESKGGSESFNSNELITGLVSSEWIDVEKVHAISSNRSERFLRSQTSSRSEIIISESLDRETSNDFMEEQVQSRNSSRKSVITENSNNPDEITPSRSTKDKSRLNSCRSEERALLNIPLNTDRSDEVKTSGRTTERSGIIEECEDTPTQTLKNDSESDRRLSVINEVSFEDIELSNIAENPKKSKRSSAAGSERTESGRTPKSHPASHRSLRNKPLNELITKPESEGLWNDLIETFSADQDQPFNWQDNFLGFLNTNQNRSINPDKEPSSPTIENGKFFEFESGGKEEDDLILSRRLRENVARSCHKSKEVSSARKRPEEKEDFLTNLDLGIENNLTKKIKSDNNAENLYYFQVEKTGNFGIGEFGDVTCWNLGGPHILEEGKPKGDGDGVLSQYHKEMAVLKQGNREKKSKIQKHLWKNLENTGNFTSKDQKVFQTNDALGSILHTDLKPSKSDNCVHPIEYSQCEAVDSSGEKNKSNSEQKPLLFDGSGKRKRRADSSISSIQYSSSECLSDEADIEELDFESVRRTVSLTDIAAQLRRSECEKLESNENLWSSRSPLFEKVGKDTQDNNATNLNIFLARKKEEDKTEPKSNWLILKQSGGKICHRENKKSRSRLTIDKSLIKKDSKEYLSFKSRPSIPSLKLKDSNCFQNFYKRVISVFCLTSNSSLPTSK